LESRRHRYPADVCACGAHGTALNTISSISKDIGRSREDRISFQLSDFRVFLVNNDVPDASDADLKQSRTCKSALGFEVDEVPVAVALIHQAPYDQPVGAAVHSRGGPALVR
jgi:hypothetical protein